MPASKEVHYLNPPANLYNEAYNPFLGIWKNESAELYGFTQLVVDRDENDLVWAELFDKCVDEQCSIGKIRAEWGYSLCSVCI